LVVVSEPHEKIASGLFCNEVEVIGWPDVLLLLVVADAQIFPEFVDYCVCRVVVTVIARDDDVKIGEFLLN